MRVCILHVRRLIGHLYRCEREWKDGGQCGPALRASLRSGHFGLILSLLKRTARTLAIRSLPNSQLGKACSYLLNQWESLAAHCRLGHTEIDNNQVENAIRPSAVGKKNWLFIGHPDAGDRLSHPLLDYRILPAPRDRAARLPARHPDPPAGDDQPGRPDTPVAIALETAAN